MMNPSSEGRIELAASEDQAGALCQLLRSGRHLVRIFSDQLDPNLFDHADIATELSRIARAGRQCEVRILIKDTEMLVKRAHRLAGLHQRLSSAVLLRKLTYCPELYPHNYVLVDDAGLFYIPNDEDKTCFSNAEDRAFVKHCAEQFDHLWERSTADPELRFMPM